MGARASRRIPSITSASRRLAQEGEHVSSLLWEVQECLTVRYFTPCKFGSSSPSWCRPQAHRERILVIMDLGFVKDGDSTLMFTLTPPQTKDAGIEVSKGCYCFVIDVSGR